MSVPFPAAEGRGDRAPHLAAVPAQDAGSRPTYPPLTRRVAVLVCALFIRVSLGYVFLGSVDLLNGITITRLMLAHQPYRLPYFPIIPGFLRLAAILAVSTPLPLAFCYKAIPILCDCLIGLLIYEIVWRRHPTVALTAGLLYALAPVALIVTCLHSQWDPVCLFFLVLAFYVRDHFARTPATQLTAGMLLSMSALVKPVSVPFLVGVLPPLGQLRPQVIRAARWALGLITVLLFVRATPWVTGVNRRIAWVLVAAVGAWLAYQVWRWQRRAIAQHLRAHALLMVGLGGCFAVAIITIWLVGGNPLAAARGVFGYGAGGVQIFGLPFAFPFDRVSAFRSRLWALGPVLLAAITYYQGALGVFEWILFSFAFLVGVSGDCPQYLAWIMPFVLAAGAFHKAAIYSLISSLFLVLYYANPHVSYIPQENMGTFIPLRGLAWLMPPEALTSADVVPFIRFLGNYLVPAASLMVAAAALTRGRRATGASCAGGRSGAPKGMAPPSLCQGTGDWNTVSLPPFSLMRNGYLIAAAALLAAAGIAALTTDSARLLSAFNAVYRAKLSAYAIAKVIPDPRFAAEYYIGDYTRSSPFDITYWLLFWTIAWSTWALLVREAPQHAAPRGRRNVCG